LVEVLAARPDLTAVHAFDRAPHPVECYSPDAILRGAARFCRGSVVAFSQVSL